MRKRFNPQPRLDCPPIEEITLNLNCRDEIIPILRALQHIYSDSKLRREILDLVGEDVNRETSTEHGRPGMDYWQIVVLAAVRLGCDLDYDKLQDLAEQHRNLRLFMGIGDWQEEVDFDWRRIRDNLCHLRPETLTKINRLVLTRKVCDTAGRRVLLDRSPNRRAGAAATGAAQRQRIRNAVLHDAGGNSYDHVEHEFSMLSRRLGWPAAATLKDLRHLFATTLGNSTMPEAYRRYLMGQNPGKAAIVAYTHLNHLQEHYTAAVYREWTPLVESIKRRLAVIS